MNAVRYTLRQLEYFVAVAETGTITTAAERCHVSAPGLSLALSELEKALSVQLFTRRRAKGAVLTTAGQAVLAHARTVLVEADELQESASMEGGQLSGSLTVGCYTTLAPFVIPRLLTGFTAAHPRVDLSFEESSQPVLERDLISGSLELAVMYGHDLHPQLGFRPISALPPYVLLPIGHPMSRKRKVSLRALCEEPLILFDVSPSTENFQRTIGKLGIEPRIGFRTESFELVRCLVARGVGYGVLFQHPKTDVTYDGERLVSRPVLEDLPVTEIGVAYLASRRLTQRALSFRDFAAAEFTDDGVGYPV
ncbi:LysR substrate-binding domain-containing protein [Nocardioides sp. DS6]|uniref:LysR substrate-binding domain-containing protein n=1 Tax=Nocardioides eburneus TaxID=3231482 RepID=A0ABV3T0N6_9ACTN